MRVHAVCCVKLLQSCPTLWDPMHYSSPVSSVHGSPRARTLEWAAIPSFGGTFLTPGWDQIARKSKLLKLGDGYVWSITVFSLLLYMLTIFQMKSLLKVYQSFESRPKAGCFYSEAVFQEGAPSLSDVSVLITLKVPACSEGLHLSVGIRTAPPVRQLSDSTHQTV